jgi:predicted enzyme related to lactoylglutathione lyase
MAKTKTGSFVWYDHLTRDPGAAVNFYGDVIGWKTQPFGEDSHYLMWVGDQGPLGGVIALPAEAAKMGAPPHWMGNVQVENVDAAVALAKTLGGKVHKEAEDIPTVGRFAIIADPQGAFLSVFQTAGGMDAHDGAKAGEFCWSELITSDSNVAFEFYAKLLGWNVIQDMDMGPMGLYRMFGVGEQRVGGMMTAPKGATMPPMWLYYVTVADLDAAIARATARGAKIMNGPMEVPSGAKIVQMMDPQGAAFALHCMPSK